MCSHSSLPKAFCLRVKNKWKKEYKRRDVSFCTPHMLQVFLVEKLHVSPEKKMQHLKVRTFVRVSAPCAADRVVTPDVFYTPAGCLLCEADE